MGYLFIWVILAILVGAFGSDKTVGFWGAFLWSLLLSPLIGIIIVIMSKSNTQKAYEDQAYRNQFHQTQMLSEMNKAKQETPTDELAKLKKLLDDKAITPEEYQTMKDKIISKFHQ
jgi:type II secretory pathway predicted ATPase ExeA